MDDCHISYITKLKKKRQKKKTKTIKPCAFLLALLVVKTNWGNNSFSVCR